MSEKQNKTYSDSMQKLEEILTRIDDSEMGVDELAEQVNQAVIHLKNCKQILSFTEKSVQNSLKELEAEFLNNPDS
jgi:exodeoxyribonuclease VII small subunit